MGGSRVIDVARRLETAIYSVAVEVDQDRQVRRGWLNRRAGSAQRAHPSDSVFRSDTKRGTSDAMALLHVLADATGGRAIEARWDTRLGSVFRSVLEEHRQRYIVTYTPEGVGTGDGWHTLDARVKRRGLVVRTRTRYWSD